MSIFSIVALVIPSLFLTPVPPPSATHYPESGSWHDPARPGEGVFVDRQGQTVGFTFFTYAADGRPEFYIAGGNCLAADS